MSQFAPVFSNTAVPNRDRSALALGPEIRGRQPDLASEIPSLTGLRAIAVLMVVLQHCWITTHRDGIAFVDHIFRSAAAMWIGVDLFFVLSGFLLTRILLRTKNERGYYRNFYARRCLRIWPLYYALLAVAAVFGLVNPHANYCSMPFSVLLWPLTFSTNFFIAIYNNWFIGLGGFALCHLWSLAVEEHFYLFWPWLIRQFKERQFLIGCVVIMVTMVVVRLVAFVLTRDYEAIGLLTPFRLDSFCAGSLAALCLSSTWRGRYTTRMLNITFYATTLMVATMMMTTHLFRGELLVSTVGYTVLAVNFASLVGVLATSNQKHFLSQILTSPTLLFLGKHSYAIYLLHLPIAKFINMTLVARHMLHSAGDLILLGILMPFVLTVLLSVGCWHVIEKPCLRLKRHFL